MESLLLPLFQMKMTPLGVKSTQGFYKLVKRPPPLTRSKEFALLNYGK
jgi:hypothetical protein